MFQNTKKILKSAKKEVIYKVITSLFIQGLALVVPVFWSNTINEVTEGNYKIGYYLILITLFLSIFYYFWSYLNQKTWYKFYNKLYTEYTKNTQNSTIRKQISHFKKCLKGMYKYFTKEDMST